MRTSRLSVLIVTLLAGVPAGAAAQQVAERSQIVVRGTGSIAIAPDRATVILDISTRAPSPSDAANGTSEVQVATVEALRAAGIGDGRVVSAGYHVSPDWKRDEAGNRELDGYIASSTVLLDTDVLDRVGDFIDVALDAGVTGIRSVTFEASNVDTARREALAGATQQARLDAEAIAQAAGGRLGRLIEITLEDPDNEPGVTLRAYAQRPATATQVEPGEQFVTATIVAVWRFVEE